MQTPRRPLRRRSSSPPAGAMGAQHLRAWGWSASSWKPQHACPRRWRRAAGCCAAIRAHRRSAKVLRTGLADRQCGREPSASLVALRAELPPPRCCRRSLPCRSEVESLPHPRACAQERRQGDSRLAAPPREVRIESRGTPGSDRRNWVCCRLSWVCLREMRKACATAGETGCRHAGAESEGRGPVRSRGWGVAEVARPRFAARRREVEHLSDGSTRAEG